MPTLPDQAAAHPLPTFSGDVVTVETARLNTKGGSMTATLKKSLRAALEEGGDAAVGARLDFGPLGSMVLLAPGAESAAAAGAGSRIRVTRLHDRRFVVDWMDDAAPAGEDPMTQAFLTMIVEAFRQGRRPLAGEAEALAELDAIEALGGDAGPPAPAPAATTPAR